MENSYPIKISELNSLEVLKDNDLLLVVDKGSVGLNAGTTKNFTADKIKNYVFSNTPINLLSDVDTSTSIPQPGQVLNWNGNSWIPGTPPGITDGNKGHILVTNNGSTWLINDSVISLSGGSSSYNDPLSINTDGIKTEKEAAIFLSNTTLGPSIHEIRNLVEIGSKRKWMLDQIYGSYDGSTYSEWNATGDSLELKTGWFGKVALHFKMPDDYEFSTLNVTYPGNFNTRASLLSAFIRNDPPVGDIGSLDPNSNSRKDSRKSLLCKIVWILNKLIPVSAPGGGFPGNEADTYAIVNWHGVLARHAFGNYADLLEEVAYSFSMALMLTHLRNQRSDETGRQPDENFGREIMQLFSIGLYELNDDGTYKLDNNGDKIETYDQYDILEASKVFTGLTRWDRPDAEYYNISYDATMRGGGVGLEGISRTSFLTDNQIVYGIAKPAIRIKKGKTYRIYSTGNTDFTKFGSSGNTTGLEFIANKDGDYSSGSGEVEEKRIYPLGVIPRLKHFLPWYEDGEKRFPNVGIVIPEGTDPETNIRLMVEGLTNHPNCAPNICKNLIKLAVTSNPSKGYVSRVTSVFRNNGKGVTGDMSAVWIAIFTDPEANLDVNSSETKGRVIDGFEAFCKYTRALGGSSRYTGDDDSAKIYIDGVLQNPAEGYLADNESARLGSWPYSSPSVFSYYGLDYSITPALDWGILLPEIGSLPANILMNAIRALEDMINSGDPIDWRAGPSETGRVYTPSFQSIIGNLEDLDNVINILNLILCRGTLSNQKIEILKNIMESMPSSSQDDLDNRVCLALQLIIRSPEFWVQ